MLPKIVILQMSLKMKRIENRVNIKTFMLQVIYGWLIKKYGCLTLQKRAWQIHHLMKNPLLRGWFHIDAKRQLCKDSEKVKNIKEKSTNSKISKKY